MSRLLSFHPVYSRSKLFLVTTLLCFSCASMPQNNRDQASRSVLRICLGEKKEGTSARKFNRLLETHLKYTTLPQALPDGIEAFYAILNPFDVPQGLSRAIFFSLRRATSAQRESSEVFPSLSNELFDISRSFCREGVDLTSPHALNLGQLPLLLTLGQEKHASQLKLKVYFGARKSEFEAPAFMAKLKEHMSEFKRKFGSSQALLYSVLVTGENLVAILGWHPESHSEWMSWALEDLKSMSDEKRVSEPVTFEKKLEPNRLYQFTLPKKRF